MLDHATVLFDTDIGSNIDDALALAYLLRQPKCRLLGITTVSGPVERRGACAVALCQAAGRTDIPIHCGASLPLLFGPGQPEVSHFDGLSDSIKALANDAGPPLAVEFLRNAIRASREPVLLLSTGPLTNIALLFALDPEIPSLLRGFVCMAGVFGPHTRDVETNCRLDPFAAAVVFEQWRRAATSGGVRVKPFITVGLDVTTRCTMPVGEFRKEMKTPLLATVVKMGDAWLRTRETVTFNDPLAAATIFRPAICGYSAGTVSVDATPGSPTAGATRFAMSPTGPHRVATSVNPAVFLREYFSVV
jgi:purine nucleosidase